MSAQKGFIQSLFDFSFSSFIAVRIVGVIYGLGILAITIICLAIIVGSFSKGFGAGLGAIILSPLIFVIYLISIRLGLEGLVAGIRTAENTAKIAENTRPNFTK